MAHDNDWPDEADYHDQVARDTGWVAGGPDTTRRGKHFGRWWAAERAIVTEEGVTTGHVFIGYQPGQGDVLRVESLAAAREFAEQLQAAIDYAETVLT
jgi:hypothetical protein